MATAIQFLESAWLILFFVSIIFIFMIIFSELGEQTRKLKHWSRISYGKMLPRISLSFQHFQRKGELLTNTSYNICRSIHKDMIDYLVASKGFNKEELAELLEDKDQLDYMFQDDEIVQFLQDPGIWLKMNEPEPSLLSKMIGPLRAIFKEKNRESNLVYVRLAILINTFRKNLETGG